jgi:hypothetical protein
MFKNGSRIRGIKMGLLDLAGLAIERRMSFKNANKIQIHRLFRIQEGFILL